MENSIFLNACFRKKTERTPIWIMRQAGRYLPEYRAVREKYDFISMCKTPELAAEVTLQPIRRFGFDAAIIFSDILVVPEAMGMKLQISESQGPIFENPISDAKQIESLNLNGLTDRLKFVFDAIKIVKNDLREVKRLSNTKQQNNDLRGAKRRSNPKLEKDGTPLLGFSGSPWTLAVYMVEGRGTNNFEKIKSFIHNCPSEAHNLLETLSSAVSEYLIGQIQAGCDAVQLFDTWSGILSPSDYEEFSLKYINRVLNDLRWRLGARSNPEHQNRRTPIILFAKGIKNFKPLAKLDCDVIGLDWTVDIGEVKKEIKGGKALQGNLDPTVLLSNPKKIKQEAEKILKSYGKGSGHIFNLGHGILPSTPLENVKTLVDFIKTKSNEFHNV